MTDLPPIPHNDLSAHEAALWWAKLNAEEQAEFIRMMMSSLHQECRIEGGYPTMQLHSIGKEMARDVNSSAAYDLKDILRSGGLLDD